MDPTEKIELDIFEDSPNILGQEEPLSSPDQVNGDGCFQRLLKKAWSTITPSNSPPSFSPVTGSTPLNLSLEQQETAFVPSNSRGTLEEEDTVRERNLSDTESEGKSLDWDNFSESPSYGKSILEASNKSSPLLAATTENFRELTISEVPVNLTPADVQSTHFGFFLTPSLALSEAVANMDDQSSMRDARVLENMITCIGEMMEDFGENDVRRGNVDDVFKILDEISKARTEFRNKVREYKQNYNLEQSSIQQLDSAVMNINRKIKTHAHLVWAKVEVIKNGADSLPSASSATAAVRRPSSTQNTNDLSFKRNVYRDQVLFLTESLKLPDDDEVEIEEHWSSQSDSEVCQGMQSLSRWEDAVKKLSNAFREYERAHSIYGDSTSVNTFQEDSEEFEQLRNKVKEVSIAVRKEDQRRNLQTLMPVKSEKVKYPTFGGDAGEDLVKFKEKINECFKKNRVPRSNVLDKLERI